MRKGVSYNLRGEKVSAGDGTWSVFPQSYSFNQENWPGCHYTIFAVFALPLVEQQWHGSGSTTLQTQEQSVMTVVGLPQEMQCYF